MLGCGPVQGWGYPAHCPAVKMKQTPVFCRFHQLGGLGGAHSEEVLCMAGAATPPSSYFPQAWGVPILMWAQRQLGYLLFRAQPPHSLRHSPGVMYTWPQCLATFPAASGKLPSDSPFPETCAEKASLTVYEEGSITR